jgi:hypothetical protein
MKTKTHTGRESGTCDQWSKTGIKIGGAHREEQQAHLRCLREAKGNGKVAVLGPAFG